ncbi:hypothetical protein TcCL_Unassigned03376 [Trypanosoma cruzi]|nr:hypothetical protein TcCL_Unassigned03376 [Trypanosoma cruzi]
MAIDGLVSCRRALEMDREPTDQFMGFGRALPQTFRTLIAITTDPSISRPPHFVPAFKWPFTRLTPSRGRPSLLWSGAQPNKNNDCCNFSCVVFMDATHLHATCAAQPEELLAAQSAIKKRRGASGCLRGRTKTAPSIPPSPTNPHTRRRTAPPTLHPIFRITRINRREGQWSLSANDARLWHDEPPTSPLWVSYMRGANEAAREMCAPSTWKQRMSLAGNLPPFAARTNGRSTRRAARPFWRQYSAWRHRPDCSTPGCCGPCCKWIEPRWKWRF